MQSRALVPVVFVVGPTAVGKSALAVHLAQAFSGEVVSADSRQVYRLMDIGTAKPSREQRDRVAHHLLDILDPDEEYGLAAFLELARGALADIHARGRLPIVAGGTGQYLWALLEGWNVPRVPPDPVLRRELEEEARRTGQHALHQRLRDADPEAASRIHPRNVRRVIRALEIHQAKGRPASPSVAKAPPPYRPLVIGLTTNRSALYSMVDARVDDMVRRGLEEEVRRLLSMGYSPALPSMSSVGYREMALHVMGLLPLTAAVQRTKGRTHRIVRHQYTWFRLVDRRIHWLTVGSRVAEEAEELVEGLTGPASRYDTIPPAAQERRR